MIKDLKPFPSKVLYVSQFLLLLIGVLSISLIVIKASGDIHETTGCDVFTVGYSIIIIGLLVSIGISIKILKTEQNLRNLALYVPMIFMIAFLFLWGSYKFGYIGIYEYTIGNPPRYCNALLHFFSPSYR